MFKFLSFCFICYLLFLLGSLLLPIVLVVGLICLVCFALKALFDFFVRKTSYDFYHYRLYTGRRRINPAIWLISTIWHNFIHLLYQLVFTVVRAINDGKNNCKRYKR